MTLIDYALWPFRQVGGAFRNLFGSITTAGLSDLLPPSVVSLIVFVADAGPRSVGFADDPWSQLSAVVVVTVAMVLASFGILTWAAVGFALFFGPPALLRFFPAVDDRWPLSASAWPFWRVNS